MHDQLRKTISGIQYHDGKAWLLIYVLNHYGTPRTSWPWYREFNGSGEGKKKQ